MARGTQTEIPLSSVIDHVIERIGQENLDFYHPSKDKLYIDDTVTILVEESEEKI